VRNRRSPRYRSRCRASRSRQTTSRLRRAARWPMSRLRDER